MSASILDDATLAALRAEAARHASPFADPAILRDAEEVLANVDGGWLERVLGHPVRRHWRWLGNAELHLAVSAARADAEHLTAVAAAQRAQYKTQQRQAAEAARAAAQAARGAWLALQARLPVAVEVWHNWTARHLDGYEQGADHIVVMADLDAGRLHRSARSPLCWTPARAHQLRHVSGNVGDERRLPDCKACLRTAERLAAASHDPGGVECGQMDEDGTETQR